MEVDREFRAAMTAAMDARMDDDEALALLGEMVLLLSGLLKASPAKDQRELAPKVIRCTNVVDYVREAFKDRDTYHRLAMDATEKARGYRQCRNCGKPPMNCDCMSDGAFAREN